MDVEALPSPKGVVSTHCLNLATLHSHCHLEEHDPLIRRIESVETNYHQDRRGMDANRKAKPSKENHKLGGQLCQDREIFTTTMRTGSMAYLELTKSP
jgi:hypothetical protein